MQPNTKAFYGEIDRQPPNDVLDIEGIVGAGPRGRRAPHRRQHRGHAVAASGRSSTAPTSSCTPPPSSSAATAPRSAASSSTAASFDFSANDKFPMFTEPDPSYHGLTYWPALGPGSYIIKARVQLLRDIGAGHHARSTRSCSSRASRRSACAWSVTTPTPQAVAEYLAGARPGRVGAATPGCRRRRGTSGPPATPAARATARCRRSSSTVAGRRGRSSSRRCRCTATWPTSATCAAWSSTRPSTTHSQLSEVEQVVHRRRARPGAPVGRPRDDRRHHRRPRPGLRRRQELSPPSGPTARGTYAPACAVGWFASRL